MKFLKKGKNEIMKIAKNTVVTLNYQIFDAQNNPIQEEQQTVSYLHGGYHNILPKIEELLEGKTAGFNSMLQIEPEEGFGDYDPELLRLEPRSRFPEPLEIGMQFEGLPDSANDPSSIAEESLIYTVTELVDDQVLLDGNHPFAGVAIRFQIEVTNIRAASPEEIEHQHVHGAHGHTHH